MKFNKNHIECKKYAEWIYYQGSFLGVIIISGMNAFLSTDNNIKILNLAFTTTFLLFLIVGIIIRIKYMKKFASGRVNE